MEKISWNKIIKKLLYLFGSVKMPARMMSQQKIYLTDQIAGYSWSSWNLERNTFYDKQKINSRIYNRVSIIFKYGKPSYLSLNKNIPKILNEFVKKWSSNCCSKGGGAILKVCWWIYFNKPWFMWCYLF